MNSNYKQIILAIAISLCCAIIRLNADLLNGPYSPESQELVKVIENKTLPIPANLKVEETNIVALQNVFEESKSLDPKDPYGTFLHRLFLQEKNRDKLNLVNKNTLFLETFIQLAKKQKLSPIFRFDISDSDYYQYYIADFLKLINNTDAFKQVAPQLSTGVKKLMLRIWVGFLEAQLRFSIDDSSYLKSVENFKEFIKILVNNMSKSDAYGAVLEKYSQDYLDTFDEIDIKILQNVIEFLLNNGFPINTYIEGETLLDRINAISKKKVFEDNSNYLKLKKYLKSKGAKTYAELTAAEKGQK